MNNITMNNKLEGSQGPPTEDLEASLSILDLGFLEEEQQQQETKKESSSSLKRKKVYMEHSVVFEEIVAETDMEHAATSNNAAAQTSKNNNNNPRMGLLQRQESERLVTTPSSDNNKNNKNSTRKSLLIRRHSSYEPKNRRKAYQLHKELQSDLEEQSTFVISSSKHVNTLLEFNLSVNMMDNTDYSMSNNNLNALHYSCPILSYMHDDEEDSIDLHRYRHHSKQQSSLTKVLEEDNWESLTEDESGFGDDSEVEYHVSIQPLQDDDDEDDRKPRKRRRSRSCRELVQQLEHDTPLHVLKSLSNQM